MGKFIDRFLNRKTSTNTAEVAEKVKHIQHLELMIAELEDMRDFWKTYPTYKDFHKLYPPKAGTYCPVGNKLHQSIDYLTLTLNEMKHTITNKDN